MRRTQLRMAPALALCLISSPWSDPARGAQPSHAPVARPAPKAGPPAVHVLCLDGSTFKLTVREEYLEVLTPYGKLQVPVADITHIDVATRLSPETARRIEADIAGLAKPDFKLREAASADLLALQERSYPALLKAAKHSDQEVAHRAEELLEAIRAAVPAERLEVRAHDVVHTRDSKFTGQVLPPVLRVTTAQFGDQQLRLADVREIRTGPAAGPAEPALPDPGTLQGYQGQVGKSYSFQVTGGAPGRQVQVLAGGGVVVGGGNGAVWGTDVYTLDSTLALAAVHAGALKQGQTGTIKVTILGPQPAFVGSVRNGVASGAYGPYPGAFRIER